MYRRRIKRASVTDIYKSCVQGGDCPTDVKNKVEGTTWADTLLKVFGSILYLGNLGIGTGRGSGGSFGYRPFNAQTPREGTSTIVRPRPTIPTVDIVGPADVLPVAPDAPAIVPLSEGIPETGIIDTPAAGPGLDSTSIDITTAVDPISEVTGVGEHPNIINVSEDVAQIDVQITPPPPKKIALDPSISHTTDVEATRISHVDSDYNVFVNPAFNGVHIGDPEYIELEQINTMAQFEIDEGPLRSTPLSDRVISRARDLYQRYVQQVPARGADLEGLTSRASTFEFTNPAFEGDLTDIFNDDLAELADNSSRQTIAFTEQPRLLETADRTIRVSRLGRRPGMTTRSGLNIGQRVHVYVDISPIPKDSVELQTFGEFSHDSSIIDELTTSSFISPFERNIQEGDVLDTLEEDFTGTHLVMVNGEVPEDNIEIPTLAPEFNMKVFVNDYAANIFSYTPLFNGPIQFPSPYTPLGPAVGLTVNFDDFDLHPSLLRKRKRSIL
ncbi:minor capsid protein [Human papillomavirus 140]|uniref:Minor capsid protein L2 n=1 Tax=Human papillomavirus 140 TaxID=1070413 RepID=I3P6M9_9PAPI|nr:minor capsid protein [Human papillomavirus 140]AEM24633.1 minor capsid protein [Human papillomavirus 140]